MDCADLPVKRLPCMVIVQHIGVVVVGFLAYRLLIKPAWLSLCCGTKGAAHHFCLIDDGDSTHIVETLCDTWINRNHIANFQKEAGFLVSFTHGGLYRMFMPA